MSIVELSLFLALLAGQATEVDVVAVESKEAEHTVRIPGELRAFQEVSLHARVPSFVEAVKVDRGSRVQANDLLVVLSAPEMQAQLAEAEARGFTAEARRLEADARLVAARETYERLKKAAETPGAISRNELLLAEKAMEASAATLKAAEGAVRAASASVESLRNLTSYLEVRAPFDGVITERRVHKGALVGPTTGSALLEIEQTSRLRLIVPVPEREYAAVRAGTSMKFTVPAHAGRTFEGKLSRLSGSMERSTRAMAVEADVPNEDGALAPGMYAEVSWIARPQRPSLLVPRTSIATTTERRFVVRVRDGKAEWVDVERGVESGGLVEVTAARLAPGDLVLLRATDEIRPGTALVPRRAPVKEAK